jgi:hypothetical protein
MKKFSALLLFICILLITTSKQINACSCMRFRVNNPDQIALKIKVQEITQKVISFDDGYEQYDTITNTIQYNLLDNLYNIPFDTDHIIVQEYRDNIQSVNCDCQRYFPNIANKIMAGREYLVFLDYSGIDNHFVIESSHEISDGNVTLELGDLAPTAIYGSLSYNETRDKLIQYRYDEGLETRNLLQNLKKGKLYTSFSLAIALHVCIMYLSYMLFASSKRHKTLSILYLIITILVVNLINFVAFIIIERSFGSGSMYGLGIPFPVWEGNFSGASNFGHFFLINMFGNAIVYTALYLFTKLIFRKIKSSKNNKKLMFVFICFVSLTLLLSTIFVYALNKTGSFQIYRNQLYFWGRPML